MMELRKHFRPELLNRIDDIVIFHALSNKHFYGIAKKMIGELAARMKQQQISLEVDDSVIDYIIEAGTDPVFGARPLKRFIQREIETRIAKELIKGEITPGSTLKVSMDANKQLLITV